MRYEPPTPPMPPMTRYDYECELPAEVRAELAKRGDALNKSDINQRQDLDGELGRTAPARSFPSWLRGFLTFAGIVCVPLAIIAIAAGLLTLFGAIGHQPTPENCAPIQ